MQRRAAGYRRQPSRDNLSIREPERSDGVQSDARFRRQHNVLNSNAPTKQSRRSQNTQHASHERGAEPERGPPAGPAATLCPALGEGRGGPRQARRHVRQRQAALSLKIDMDDGAGKKGRGNAKGHDKRDRDGDREDRGSKRGRD